MKMTRKTALMLTATAALAFAAPAMAEVTTNTAAPDFTAVDSNGISHSLSDFKGKTVVLEWTNHECPYVVRHYKDGNMQGTQEATKSTLNDDVVWLSVVSSAPGNQGYVTPAQANQVKADKGSNATAVLLDPTGELGRLYGAKTTPHMYVVDPDGTLSYQGAIDDKPRGESSSATNYVKMAAVEMAAGQAVSNPQTTPYGCGVKY